MRMIMFLLLALPVLAFAKNGKDAKATKLKSIKLHFEKNMVINPGHAMLNDRSVHNRIMLPGPGDMNFGRDTGMTTMQKAAPCDVCPNWPKAYMSAENVTISCPAYPDLTADRFVYDDLTSVAMLSGNVTLAGKCIDRQIGEVVYLDLSDNEYKIIGIK
jgi:hypothetical protein